MCVYMCMEVRTRPAVSMMGKQGGEGREEGVTTAELHSVQLFSNETMQVNQLYVLPGGPLDTAVSYTQTSCNAPCEHNSPGSQAYHIFCSLLCVDNDTQKQKKQMAGIIHHVSNSRWTREEGVWSLD